MLMLRSTCFGHHYAHRQELTTIAVTTFDPETHPSYLHLSFHPAATREPDDLCGNQRYRRKLLTMGIMVPETC